MFLIKSGGGTGPLMPGNLFLQGAKSSGFYRKMRLYDLPHIGQVFFIKGEEYG